MWLIRCLKFSKGFILIFFKTNACVSFALSKLSVYLFMFVLKCQNKQYLLANECSFFKTQPIVFLLIWIYDRLPLLVILMFCLSKYHISLFLGIQRVGDIWIMKKPLLGQITLLITFQVTLIAGCPFSYRSREITSTWYVLSCMDTLLIL